MPFFTPDDYLSSVLVIDPQELLEQGFNVVLLDIDNTLVSRDTHMLTDEVRLWVASLKDAGLKPGLISNNWHKTVFAYAADLDIPLVYKAMKPMPFAYLRAANKAGRNKGDKVVVIGDQIVTDVWGAHLLGYHVILVEPLATKDLWYTQLFRKLERLLMKGRTPRV